MKEYSNNGDVLFFDKDKNNIENKIIEYTDNFETIKTNKGELLNIACAFDIETTSFYDHDQKVGLMYEWTFGINGLVIIGRTWKEFKTLCLFLSKHFSLKVKRNLVVYVHNLGFEFQFLCKLFKWEKVFSVEERKPVYALNTIGILFKCSYLLSGYSLESVANNLNKYDIKKLVGDLDYSLKRHSNTPLKDDELQYCINDVRIVMSYIQEQIIYCKSIAYIPLTKTGFVRKYCKEKCIYNESRGKNKYNEYRKYRSLMKQLTLTRVEYEMAKRAFQGGFTHSNPINCNHTFENVASYDFTSSYPSVIVCEDSFPMSKGELVDVQSYSQFEEYLNKYCCLFDVQFTNIESKIENEHYISVSKCFKIGEHITDNGRLVKADYIAMTITEQDYFLIKYVYNWENIKIGRFYIYEKGYLPKQFIKAVLDLYQDKTQLKDVEGKEIEYQHSKEYLNSCYGMMVTDPCRDETLFENIWKCVPVDIDEALESYNKNKTRYLFYLWGIWTTALARRNLWSGIKRIKNDYIYSDTDSLKILNKEKHKDYFENYNNVIKEKMIKMCKHYGFDESLVHPKTKTGKEKWLGVWDYEGDYQKFKCLGAKRYMTLKNDKLSFTISGVNKKEGVPYLLKKYNNNVDQIFDEFKDGLEFPIEATGKLIHTYIDEERTGVIVDYLGNIFKYKEKSGVHLEGCEYNLSISQAYIEFLRGLKEFKHYGE